MLSPSDREYISSRAYVSEQVVDYVAAVSETEPFLFMEHVLYVKGEVLIFVGYPLDGAFTEERLQRCLEGAAAQFRPRTLSLIAPRMPDWKKQAERGRGDAYYRLDLRSLNPGSKVMNMVRRASTEISCERGNELQEEHIQMVGDFVKGRDLDEGTRFIFGRVPHYVSTVPTALVFSARARSGRLVAFTVAEYGTKEYAFYMFNFRSEGDTVPGASDLLLHEAMQTALKQRKPFMNLGLGISEGVTFFKRKWRAQHFLDYETCTYRLSRSQLLDWLSIFTRQ